MPPEAWAPHVFGHVGLPYDIWSLACVLLELHTLKPAIAANTLGGVVREVCDLPSPRIPKHCAFGGTLRRMLFKPTVTRIEAADVHELLQLRPSVRHHAASVGASVRTMSTPRARNGKLRLSSGLSWLVRAAKSAAASRVPLSPALGSRMNEALPAGQLSQLEVFQKGHSLSKADPSMIASSTS